MPSNSYTFANYVLLLQRRQNIQNIIQNDTANPKNLKIKPKASKIFCPENQVKIGSTFIVNVDTDFGAKIELFKISRPDDENLELRVDFYDNKNVYDFWDNRTNRINFMFGFFFLEPFLILPGPQMTAIFCLLDENCEPYEISHKFISQKSDLAIINYNFQTGIDSGPDQNSILFPTILAKVILKLIKIY